MSTHQPITLRLNGRARQLRVPPTQTLLETLREHGHFEVKSGCEKGDCGACAVLVDGVALDSCLTLTWTVAERAVTTVAGLGDSAAPHPLQTAFIESGAVQCGYCTPGLIIAAESLLRRNPDPGEDDVRLALSGNLCRCTGYTKVVEAVSAAAKATRASHPAPAPG